MGYRNLSATIAQIEAAGLTDTIDRILSVASNPVVVQHEVHLDCIEPKQVDRIIRLLYQYFYHFPEQKARLSFRKSGLTVIVIFRDRLENRGRKGLKEAK